MNQTTQPFLALEAQTKKLFFCTFNYKILPLTTRRTYGKSFAKVDCTDSEIITFEVERKVSFVIAL